MQLAVGTMTKRQLTGSCRLLVMDKCKKQVWLSGFSFGS